ncbi:hypothetical protein [Romboutsia lituseburensis]|uniref:Cell-wall binding lipoprotein n=1 Tax=Romboutsia lituseburensis DSM 797 TaxID=1121325 RepID=A0A1G9KL89_9FIRM|nr:hypothetical protein [Romboutsia lituseburensis]CEH34946.1 Prokaryotic membrane lipoprotein lipid attachment site profile [Romboutsia lituseburensis]SDL50183.1 hypothetical protein SAMN04515677_102182 [Romboutsia lituseburensis DSM 797]
MNFKKIATTGLSLALILGVTGCTSKTKTVEEKKVETPTTEETKVVDKEYVNKYSKIYGDYETGLKDYEMYLTPEKVTEYYTTNEYPGNEKYLENVKMAYKTSKEKTQAYVDSLKNDMKTDDADLKKMNEGLIAEGEKTIANIDEKLKRLDEIPKDAVSKTQEEYIKVVDESIKIKDETKSEFTKMIDEMNKKLGINVNNNTNEKVK